MKYFLRKTLILFSVLFISIQINAQCTSVVAGTSFDPMVATDSMYAWDFNNISQSGMSGNTFSSILPYFTDAKQFSTDSIPELVYAITDNPSKLDTNFMDIEDPMLVIQYMKAATSMSSFFSLKVPGLKEGSDFTITLSYYVLTPSSLAQSCLGGSGGYYPSVDFRAAVNPDAYGSATYAENVSVSSELTQTLQTVTLTGTVDDKKYVDFNLLFGYNGKADCIAIGITDIKIQSCYDPKIKSSQGLEVCEGEQTLLSLDKEYGASSYQWQRKVSGGTWTDIATTKSVLFEMKEAATFRCIVDGQESNELELTTTVCCEENGIAASRKTIFWEDFGSFKDGRTYVDKDGNVSTIPAENVDFRTDVSFSIPSHTFDPNGQVNDDHYAVIVPTSTGYYLTSNTTATWMIGVTADHTSEITGVADGAALFINVNKSLMYSGPVFEGQIDGICSGKELFFECYIANMSGADYEPLVTLNILDMGGNVLAKVEDVVATKGGGWIPIRIQDLILDGTGTQSVIIQVVSSCGTFCSNGSYWDKGNDLVIDDIKFMVCSPPSVEAYSDITTYMKDTVICSNSVFKIEAPKSTLLDNFFNKKQNYLFQYSSEGTSWTNLSSPIVDNFLEINTVDYTDNTMYFRVVVATEASLAEFVTNPNLADFSDNCRNYSITEPFVITRKADLNMGSRYSTSACVGESVLLPGFDNDDIVSWQWEDENATVLQPKSSDEENKSFTFTLSQDSTLYFVGYTAEGCRGKRQYNVTANPTAEVSLSMTSVCDSTIVEATSVPATATLDWTLDDVAYTASGKRLVFDETSTLGKLKVQASATNYCNSLFDSVSLVLKVSPEVPVTTEESYIVTSGSQDISSLATALTGNTLMWYGDGTTYTTPGVIVAPSVPLTSEGEYVYWVTQTNADGCESDTSRVTVTVNDSPVPATSDTMVCVNSAVDLSDLVEAEDATYTLNWFTESTAAKGMGSSAVPSVNTSVPGSYDFYVSQTNSQTTAESNKSKITVDVYGVKAPDAGSDISVCAGDPAISITGTMVSDAASYYGADAALLWYEGGSLLSTAPSPSTNVTATTEYIYAAGQTYTLSTGEVCSGPLDSVKVTVNYTEKPTVSDNIIYMMSDTTADGKNMNATLLTQAGASISTGLTNYTYNWYSSDGTLIGNDVTPAAPADKTQDAVITYYLSVTNTDTNCESDTIAVTVEIYSSPSPSTATVYYCKDATATELTATKGTPLNGGSVDDYVLVWYDTDGTTALATAPTPLTTTVGKQTYYVSQKNSQTGSESGKVKADVIVYDVKTPTVGADLSYCKGETPITLSYTEEKDEAAYYMADGFIWTVNKADQAVGTVPTISTDVASTTTTTYGVRQTYTLQSGEVCEGEEEAFEVTVTAVEAPTGSYQANYVRIDAVNNGGTFPNNLTTQSPTVATASAGCELLWYDATGTLIGDGMTAPTPEYNSSWPAGTDEVLTYYVAQRDIATNCVSEKKQVTVTISDSPMPITSQLSYCVGDAAQNATFAADLQSAVTINYSANATGNYSLLWFATETESKTNPTNGVTTPTLVPTTDAAGVQKFYVCQYDNENKAMSSPSTVTVTVYAVPVLTTTATTPVCSQDGAVVTVDLNSGYSTDIVTTAAFYSDAAATTEISASVTTTGTYYARGSYMPTTTLTCYSNVSDIYVDIQDLQTPVITGETLTCPSTAISLSAAATSTNPGASAITYSWMGSDGSTGTTAAFTSGTLSSTPGDSYSFTVTAKVGVCTGLSATHVVKINDAPVDGTLTVTEANNSLSPLSITTQTGGQFYSCGGELTMAAAFTKTEGDYTWYRGGSSMGTGDQQIVTPTDGDEIYRVEYINKCPTYVEFTVSSIPLTVTPTETALETMCEGNPFSTGITIVCDETPTIKWFREGNELSGSNVSTYTIAQVKDADDGQYSYEVTNRGCKATGDAASLDAQPYIKVTNQTTPYIVPRNGSQSIPLNITVPSNGSVATIDWKENGLSVFTGNPYSVTDVVSDHAYSIELSDPDYCSDTTTATIWVDAELQLSATLTDTMCYGETKVLTIDTTGTGTFRQSGVAVILKVTETAGGTTTDITSKISKNGSNLEVQLSPTQTSTYLITFEYGSQKTSWTQSMVVLQPINLTVPATPTICEGEEATLEVTNISPVGTTISWNSDPTITSTELTEVTSVTVAPTYQGSASGSHQSTYTYTFVANFPRCETKSYTASVKVDEPLSGNIVGDSVICEGKSSRLDASAYDASSYIWSKSTAAGDSIVGYGSIVTIKPTTTTTYDLAVSRGACTTTDSYNLEVAPTPVILSIDSVNIRDRRVIADETIGKQPFLYWVDAHTEEATPDELLTDLSFSSHVAHLKDENGCETSYPFTMDPPAITIPEYFSPNGDGVNDSWTVPMLSDIYPDSEVKIYDRYGKLLTEFLGSDADGWDGSYNGKSMPSTDYWYVIDIEEIDKQYVGHFTLIRQ